MNTYRTRFGLWLISQGSKLLPRGPSKDEIRSIVRALRMKIEACQ